MVAKITNNNYFVELEKIVIIHTLLQQVRVWTLLFSFMDGINNGNTSNDVISRN